MHCLYKNIVLIGMPGTGKSTAGVILAKQMGYEFVDTDLLLIKRAGKTLPEILAETGVDGFLKLEGQVGESIHCEKCVIATGGSMVFSESAMKNLCGQNVVVWLDTELHVLEYRLKNSAGRGIAAPPGETVAGIYEARKPLYEKYADIRVHCTGNTDHVVSQIKEAIRSR
jgi:shikimate kinase